MASAPTEDCRMLQWRAFCTDMQNQAFKAMWPSTAIWQRTLRAADKLSPALAQDIIADIPDPEICRSREAPAGWRSNRHAFGNGGCGLPQERGVAFIFILVIGANT
jgi:hypothetical protein